MEEIKLSLKTTLKYENSTQMIIIVNYSKLCEAKSEGCVRVFVVSSESFCHPGQTWEGAQNENFYKPAIFRQI